MCIQKFEALYLFVQFISYDRRMPAYAGMGITDVMLLWHFTVDFGSAVGPSHHVDVGSVVVFQKHALFPSSGLKLKIACTPECHKHYPHQHSVRKKKGVLSWAWSNFLFFL
jgi:hypothetical protein